MKKLLSLLLALALVVSGLTFAPAAKAEAATKASDLVEVNISGMDGETFDASRIIVGSCFDMRNAIENEEIEPFFIGKSGSVVTVEFIAKEDISLYVNAPGYQDVYFFYTLYADVYLTDKIASYNNAVLHGHFNLSKGQKLYLALKNSGYGTKSFATYAAVEPAASAYEITKVTKDSDGYTLFFKTNLSKDASKKLASIDGKFYEGAMKGVKTYTYAVRDTKSAPKSYSLVQTSDGFKVTVPTDEEFTSFISLADKEGEVMSRSSEVYDVAKLYKKYKDGKSDSKDTKETASEASICCVAGTNVIAGLADANVKVTVKVGKKSYKTESDANGFWFVKTSKLKKGTAVTVTAGEQKTSLKVSK